MPELVRRPGLQRAWWFYAAVFLSLALVGALAVLLWGPIPDATPGVQSSRVLAADGQVVSLLHGEENRTIVPITGMASPLQQAVVATEDQAFYRHPGISIRGLLRAAVANLRGGELRQGGSTITQQYARNAFEQVGRERTIWRKIREGGLALKLERRYSKDKILESYLNTVYFGRGAYGAEAAARTYFKKSAKDLSLSESAYLAGVIRAPERYQPDSNLEAAVSIRNKVLLDMVQADFLTPAAAEGGKKEELKFSFGAAPEVRAAYFVEYVRRLLKKPTEEGGFGLTDREILGGGLEVHTTLDLRMQDAAQKAIASTLDRPEDPEAALVALDVHGKLRAMVGGRSFGDLERARGFNFAYQKGSNIGGRQSGSAFKPFTLAAFVNEGYSVQSSFSGSSPTTIRDPECRNSNGSAWRVSNFGNQGFGVLKVTDATAHSVNTIFAQMVDLVTPGTVQQMAKDAGITSELSPVCSITLGVHGVTPLEMARAFATFATRGERPEVLAVTKIIAPDGELIAERSPRREQVLGQNVADTVNMALQEVIARGTGTGARIGRPAAGKTGTTQNHVDAWFVGYTPELVASIWMGFPPRDGKIAEMTRVHGRAVTGGFLPATIWRKFMIEATKGMEPIGFPGPQIGGKIVKPPPPPCPSPGETPSEDSPSPVYSEACPSPSPSESPSPTPTDSPMPTPKLPSPSPGPTADSSTPQSAPTRLRDPPGRDSSSQPGP
jgi:penicillin-binding protein 1A